MKISQILKYSGILLGIIGGLALISQHPILILIIGIGAAAYFAGVSYAKQGK